MLTAREAASIERPEGFVDEDGKFFVRYHGVGGEQVIPGLDAERHFWQSCQDIKEELTPSNISEYVTQYVSADDRQTEAELGKFVVWIRERVAAKDAERLRAREIEIEDVRSVCGISATDVSGASDGE